MPYKCEKYLMENLASSALRMGIKGISHLKPANIKAGYKAIVKPTFTHAPEAIDAVRKLGAVDAAKRMVWHNRKAVVGNAVKKVAPATAGLTGSLASWDIGQRVFDKTGIKMLKDPSDAAAKANERMDDVEGKLQAANAPSAIASKVAANAGKAALGVGAVAGAVGAASVGHGIIKGVMQKRNWAANGCSSIIDPAQKAQCENHVKNEKLKNLNRQMQQCRDEPCRAALRSSISKIVNSGGD